MDKLGNLRTLLNDVTSEKTSKDFDNMTIEELSKELRTTMNRENAIIQEISNLEKNGAKNKIIEYAKTVCLNSTRRKILQIQER